MAQLCVNCGGIIPSTNKPFGDCSCHPKMLSAQLTSKASKVEQNKSLCGCPMCSYHSEAYELTHKPDEEAN